MASRREHTPKDRPPTTPPANPSMLRTTSTSNATTPEPFPAPRHLRPPKQPQLVPTQYIPQTIDDAKTYLQACRLFIKTETATPSNLLSALNFASLHPDSAIAAFASSIALLLPEAVEHQLSQKLANTLDGLSKKLDDFQLQLTNGLSSHDSRFSLLEDRLFSPLKPTEPQPTAVVPPKSYAAASATEATALPKPMPRRLSIPSEPPRTRPLRSNAERARRIRAQGSRILIEPREGPLQDSTANLSARALVQKAQLAWDAACKVLFKDTDTENLNPPRIVFKTATRLPRGGIEYELENRRQAAYLSDAQVARELETGFGDVVCKGQGATVLLRCAPIEFQPDNPAAISSFEQDNELNPGDVLTMAWCKPISRRRPDQTRAILRLELRSHEVADRLITYGGVLDFERVLFEKAQQEPMRCRRCQKFGHKVANCEAKTEACSRCGGPHHSAKCDKDTLSCVNCDSDQHASHDRSCPTYRAKLRRFNKSRPDNRSLLFNPLDTA